MESKKIKIQICDGPDGCGRILADYYTCPQRCDWTHHGHQSKYRDKVNNAPLMSRLTVCEFDIAALTPTPDVQGRAAELPAFSCIHCLPIQCGCPCHAKCIGCPLDRGKQHVPSCPKSAVVTRVGRCRPRYAGSGDGIEGLIIRGVKEAVYQIAGEHNSYMALRDQHPGWTRKEPTENDVT